MYRQRQSFDNKFITLAIHSENVAPEIVDLLARHGVSVRQEPVVQRKSGIISGIRLSVLERDLPFALKVVESGLDADRISEQLKLSGSSRILLIPVDFSSYTIMAVRIGFEFAARLSLKPLLLHAYAVPSFSVSLSISSDPSDEVAQEEDATIMRENAMKAMSDLKKQIDLLQKQGVIADLIFSTAVARGVPEDVILQYTRMNSPGLVVMATRGISKKEQELVGSVAAEVLDSCRVPLLTLPENYKYTGVRDISKLVFFCNLDSQDVLSVDMLMRMFGFPDVHVTLIPVNDRLDPHTVGNKLNSLQDYFSANYPLSSFSSVIFHKKSFREDLENFIAHDNVQLFIVPNKKKNIFARLFRPGIAHRMLFERDMPMLALPV